MAVSLLRASVVTVFTLCSSAGFAEKLVDPDAVAPEHRAAAEKRRAEQIKLMDCTKNVDAEKVLRRDRAKLISQCVDK